MKPIEQAIIEDLFEMGDGWILDFNNDSLQKFVKKSIDINIYKDENYTDYKSKAKKMKQIFEEESDKKVAKLLKDLIEYYEGYAYKNKKENRK
jgi:beta-glucosidase-like glycosyl hydrolase